MKEDTLMTTSAAARRMGTSEGAVRYRAATGKLPFLRTSNGQRLFRESDVMKFVEKMNEKEPTTAA